MIFHLLFLTLSLLASPSEPHVLFLGDSLTEGYGIPLEKAYPTLIDGELKAKGLKFKITNASISGSTSASGAGRLKWQLKNKPDILFLALGANDGLRGLPTESIYKNLEAVIQTAQKEKIRVILAGIKIPTNYGGPYRQKFEAVFSDLAKKYSLTFVPFLLDGVAMKKELNLPDGVHPNEKGHAIMAKNVLPIIEKAIKDLHAP